MRRRDFLAWGWLPFFRPKEIRLAGARFRILRYGRSRRRYLLIHGNEESARAVLERHLLNHEGVAYVVQNHTRNVEVDGLQLDPNRMFTRVGAEASLRKLNPDADPPAIARALATLDQGRGHLLSALTPPTGGVTIALHNNETYSVQDEVGISEDKSLREPDNPHAFFLCTDPRDFAVIRTSPYNVVLEQHPPPPDDGSLSRVAASQGFRYVNLEVAHGQTERQREMLGWLEWNLR
jgi:hypothetical protein